MIKSDFGTVAICGRKSTIIAELVTLMRNLRKSGFSDADIEYCVKRSKITNEEIIAEFLSGGSAEKEKKPDKAVVVSVDADTQAEDVAKQISDVVTKAVREMLDSQKEE